MSATLPKKGLGVGGEVEDYNQSGEITSTQYVIFTYAFRLGFR